MAIDSINLGNIQRAAATSQFGSLTSPRVKSNLEIQKVINPSLNINDPMGYLTVENMELAQAVAEGKYNIYDPMEAALSIPINETQKTSDKARDDIIFQQTLNNWAVRGTPILREKQLDFIC